MVLRLNLPAEPEQPNGDVWVDGLFFLQVDNGVLLGKALQMHDAWLDENNVKSKRFVVATWSDWDCRTMLDSECLYKGLPKPLYFNRSLLPSTCSWLMTLVPNSFGSFVLSRKMNGFVYCGLSMSTVENFCLQLGGICSDRCSEDPRSEQGGISFAILGDICWRLSPVRIRLADENQGF